MKSQLTKKQKEAASHFEGPAIVIAGPGSGKTRVLIDRVCFLVEEKGIDPSKIAVTTFTEKVTGEMKNRLAMKIPKAASLVHVSTIHSLCRHYLEIVYPYHDLGLSFSVLSTDDQELLINAKKSAWKLVGANGWRSPLKKYYFSGAIESTISGFYGFMTTNGITTQKLIDTLNQTGQLTHDLQRVIESYDFYIEYKKSEQLVDFDELLRRVFDLIKVNPEVKDRLQKLFDFYLIDEYQDTDPIQAEIFHEIVGKHKNIFVVGDVNQSIYGFRGASVDNFKNFTAHYPHAKEYFLVDNFRSTATIVEAANKLLEGELIEELQAKRKRGNPIVLIRSQDRDGSIKSVVEYIKRLNENGVLKSYGDIAVLGRTNRIVNEFIPFLTNKKIPFISFSDGSFFKLEEIQSHIYFLSYVFQHELCESKYCEWQGWWNVEEFTGDVLGLSEDGEKAIHRFTERLFMLKNEKDLQKAGFHKPEDIRKILSLNLLREEISKNPGSISFLEALFRIFEITGYLKKAINDLAKTEIVLNLALLTELIGNYSESMKRPTIVGLLNFLHEKTRQGKTNRRQIEHSDSLKLMTIHRSKGLEFPLVIIPGLTEGSFPLRFQPHDILGFKVPDELLLCKSKSDPELLQYSEELRLFYVAITRAQDGLILLTSDKINTQNTKSSRFLHLIKDFITDEVNTIDAIETTYSLPERIYQISYSSLDTYDDCPYRYWLLYELGFKTPEIYTQKVGIIIHNVLQMINNDLHAGRAVSDSMIDEYINKFWITISTPSQEAGKKADLYTEFKKYLRNFKERYKAVIAAEKPFSYISDKVIIKGKADLLAMKKNGEIELVDFKVMSEEGLDHLNVSDQLNLYQYCMNNEDIRSLCAYTFYDGIFRMYEKDNGLLKGFLEQNLRGIRENQYPRNTDSRFHKSGYCPFEFLCKE